MLPVIFKTEKIIFSNPNIQRNEITQYTLNKAGIYGWCRPDSGFGRRFGLNKKNEKFYIGSAIKLNNRVNDY